jgi:L-lysine exporter family protein LysE/ArgO
MTSALLATASGLGLGLALIVAIGAQNAFVLRQGLKREYVFPAALICALSDAVLIAAGVAGLGAIVQRSETLIFAVTAGGAAFLFGYGLRAFARAVRPRTMVAAEGGTGSMRSAVAACLAFTFLNPHVYLDTVLLVGSLAARYPGALRAAYGAGAMLASFVWFFGLGYGARVLAPLFAGSRAWRVLDAAIGIVMWVIAAGLVAVLTR